MNQDKAVTKNIITSAVAGKKNWKLFIFILAVLVVIGTGTYYLHHKFAHHVDLSNRTPMQKAEYYEATGNYKAAEKVWDTDLASTKDVQSKVAIYYQQSALATNTQHYKDAKTYAEKAQKLAPNSSVPYVALAELAQAQGDKATARKDWQQAIAHVDPNAPGANLLLRDYKVKLESVR